jgi:OOP family OmpA-OmpF porin
MNRALGIAVIAVACLPTGAQAQEAYRSYKGAFFGIAGGPSKMSFSSDSVQAGNGTASALATEQSSTAFKGFGGYRFNKNFAVEGGLASLGRFTATRTYTGPVNGTLKADIAVIGSYANAVGIIPLGEHFEVFGKGGLIVTGTTADLSTTGGVTTLTGATTVVSIRAGLHVGAGMEVRFDRKIGLMVEYEEAIGVGDSQNTGAGNIGTGYVGLTFRF